MVTFATALMACIQHFVKRDFCLLARFTQFFVGHVAKRNMRVRMDSNISFAALLAMVRKRPITHRGAVYFAVIDQLYTAAAIWAFCRWRQRVFDPADRATTDVG